jgi:SAM-dependent methyltransferase
MITSAFIESITSAAFRIRVKELSASDPSVTVLSYIMSAEKLLEWAHAVPQDAALRKLLPPVPPKDLRSKTASADEEVFLWTGMLDLSNFWDIYQRHGGLPAGRRASILDFGCGAGRMVRYLGQMADVDAHAIDINPELVKWCQKNLTAVTTSQNTDAPPMPLADASFDMVYSMSIFTHLPEDNTKAWLNDIARVLRPGGLLILTTHGYPALEIIRNSDIHQKMFDVNAQRTGELIDQLKREHFIHLGYEWRLLSFAKAGKRYGNTFIDGDYVNTNWNTSNLEVLEHLPGGLRGWQDVVVLRRKAST